jgi:hypothetical protein
MVTAMLDFKGMKKAQYEELIQNLQAKGAAPVGRVFHVATEKPDGVLAFDVWESAEKLQAFGAKLGPILEGMGMTLPEPQVYPTIVAIKD